jgi:hypothetical protein
MKPMVLVIVGTAMLMLALHHQTEQSNNQREDQRHPNRMHVKVHSKEHITETFSEVAVWLERIQ